MSTRTDSRSEIPVIRTAAAIVAIAVTLGSGFIAWGGLDQRVKAIEGARSQKIERDALREQLGEFRSEARARFDRLERILLERQK